MVVSDDYPISNDFSYGDDTFHVHSLVEHKIAPHPSTYTKGPALLFKVKWEGYDSSEDSWEPCVNVKRTDCFGDYIKHNENFALCYSLMNKKVEFFIPLTIPASS